MKGGKGEGKAGKGEAARLDALGPEGMARLKAAGNDVANGNPGKAAPVYAHLAAQARADNRSRMATRFMLASSVAYRKAGDVTQAIQMARLATEDASHMEAKRFAASMFIPTIRGLRQLGKTADAAQIEQLVLQKTGMSQIPGLGHPAAGGKGGGGGGGKAHVALPARCPTCGAPVSSAEVEFDENGNADCEYCGAVLTGA